MKRLLILGALLVCGVWTLGGFTLLALILRPALSNPSLLSGPAAAEVISPALFVSVLTLPSPFLLLLAWRHFRKLMNGS